MDSKKIRQLAINAMLAAMCAVLGYVSLDFGNLKITFESVPILTGALLFGPVNGACIGGIGTLIYQLLRYGITVTTPLWILPYVICGILVGLSAKKRGFALSKKQTAVIVIANELLITLLNTGVMYIDSKVYGYYSFVYIFGTFVLRLVICVAKAAVYSLALSELLPKLKKLNL